MVSVINRRSGASLTFQLVPCRFGRVLFHYASSRCTRGKSVVNVKSPLEHLPPPSRQKNSPLRPRVTLLIVTNGARCSRCLFIFCRLTGGAGAATTWRTYKPRENMNETSSELFAIRNRKKGRPVLVQRANGVRLPNSSTLSRLR